MYYEFKWILTEVNELLLIKFILLENRFAFFYEIKEMPYLFDQFQVLYWFDNIIIIQ